MFKSFRNKMLGIFFSVITLLIIISLTYVYYQSYTEMYDSIQIRLGTNDTLQKPIDETEQNGNNAIKPDDVKSKQEQFERDGIIVNSADDVQTTMDNYFQEQVSIDTDKCIIQTSSEIYAYNFAENQYKIVKISYDVEYLHNLRNNLLLLGIFAIITFTVVGFILITRLIKPIEEAYVMQQQFVSDASHELKTPLAIIKSCLSLATIADEESQQLVAYCQGETDRLIRLTNNLLQLSDNTIDSYQQIDVTKVINLTVSGLEVEMFEQQINFKSNIESNIFGRIAGDDIIQLLHILIDNGIKYSDQRKRINLRVYQDNKYLRIELKNSSDFIDHQELQKIFERFYRVDKVRQEHGFGLGLALAKHICDKYNGSIKATYESGYFISSIKLEK